MDSGSAIPSTSREDFYNLKISLPTLPTQRRIAEILGSLDDKIELNRRMQRNPRSHRPRHLQILVRGFRPGQSQSRRPPARRHGRRNRRPLPRLDGRRYSARVEDGEVV